jgi:hypothetical protein
VIFFNGLMRAKGGTGTTKIGDTFYRKELRPFVSLCVFPRSLAGPAWTSQPVKKVARPGTTCLDHFSISLQSSHLKKRLWDGF